MIKSISFNQAEILQNIVALHTGPIECDVTFGSGCFYKNGIARPALCFDIAPRKPGVIAADVRHLPLKGGCLRSVMLDPPFLARTGPGATLKERFGELVGTIQDLWAFYFQAMTEIHRVVKPGGWLVMKCQDGVLSGVNNNTYVKVCNMAESLGFKWIDTFILLAKFRMNHPKHTRQLHARKFHCFFVVFKKRREAIMSRPHTPRKNAPAHYPGAIPVRVGLSFWGGGRRHRAGHLTTKHIFL